MLVDMEELPRDVAGVLVVKRGVTVLWLVVDVDVSVGTVTEFVTTLKVVSALWVVGEDGMLFVVVSEVLVSASVEVRSLVELSEPVVLVAVDSVVAGVGVDTSVLTEEGGAVVDNVKVLVSMGVDVVDAGEWSVLMGVTDDVTDDGEDTSVVTGWLEVSLGGVAVVVCSALVPVAGEVVLVA